MDAAVIIAEYKEQLKALGYADKTIELYRWGLGDFTDYLHRLGITDLRTVTRQIALDYRAQVMAGKLAAESKAIKIRPVKRLFEYLTRTNQLLINPTEGLVEIHREKRKIGTVLTPDEVQRLLKQPNMSLKTGIRDRAILETLYSTAMRIDELLRLEIYDVDLKDGVIHVRKGKGGKQRVVPIGKSAAAFLKEYLEKVRPHYGKKHPKERRLFLIDRGEPMKWHNIRQNMRKCAVKARVDKNASPHTLRRSCATHMLNQGADIRHIQLLLGHSSLNTTQRYLKVTPIDIKRTHEETHPNGRETDNPGIPQTAASP
jgi:integrase/recombinase XerD